MDNTLQKNIRVIVDANVIIDVFQKREPFLSDSEEVLRLCAKRTYRHHGKSLISHIVLHFAEVLFTKRLAKNTSSTRTFFPRAQ